MLLLYIGEELFHLAVMTGIQPVRGQLAGSHFRFQLLQRRSVDIAGYDVRTLPQTKPDNFLANP
ncbi:hypothetical protein D3C81_2330440 [compost metagenome]